VTFPKDDYGYAIVTSLKHQDVNYKVYNSNPKWAYCECLQSQRGTICKYKIKLLMFFRLDLVEGTIVGYYSLLNVTLNSGLSRMFNPCQFSHLVHNRH
jgi:hypothetical protein